MYVAKAEGRDRVRTAPIATPMELTPPPRGFRGRGG